MIENPNTRGNQKGTDQSIDELDPSTFQLLFKCCTRKRDTNIDRRINTAGQRAHGELYGKCVLRIDKGKEFNLVDGDGLALRVKPNGSKLWILNYYRPYTKKRTSLSLGTYPSITLAEARLKRTELRKLLTDDIDPKEYREEQ
mgnify:CR=1 FL=1